MPPGSWLSCRADGGPEPATDLPAARPGFGRGDHALARCCTWIARPARTSYPSRGRSLALSTARSAHAGQPQTRRRCDQLIGLDISDCPYCGLRQPASTGPHEPKRSAPSGGTGPRGRRFAIALVTPSRPRPRPRRGRWGPTQPRPRRSPGRHDPHDDTHDAEAPAHNHALVDHADVHDATHHDDDHQLTTTTPRRTARAAAAGRRRRLERQRAAGRAAAPA
jgi:hypothetical protein